MAAAEVNEPDRPGACWRLWLAAFFLLACVAYGNLENNDTKCTMQGARAFVRRGDSGLLLPKDGGDSASEQEAARQISTGLFGKTGHDGVHQYPWFPMAHVFAMTPTVAVGEALGAAFPQVEVRFQELSGELYPYGQFVFDQGLTALLLPAAFGATTLLLLYLLARTFGNSQRSSLLCAAAIGLGTQSFALMRETLSDGPGQTWLLLALLGIARASQGRSTPRLQVLAGCATGLAMLTRYQHVFPVAVLIAWMAFVTLRRGDRRSLWLFVAGGAPMAAVLFGVNYARFADLFETGYPPPLTWLDRSPLVGLPMILFAAAKGVMWLSPMMWIGFYGLRRREWAPELRWLAILMLAIPVGMFSFTNGWQSGQCWGIRYVTAGLCTFLGLLLPQVRPWQRWPRTFWLLLVAGLSVNLTSMAASTRGHIQLASQATVAHYENQLERGAISEQDMAAVRVDEANYYFVLPRWSPLHTNWRYAAQSWRGAFEDAAGRRLDGVERTIGALFGVESNRPERGRAPVFWEDREFRWFWWKFWGDLLGVPAWLLMAPPLLLGALFARAAWRRLSKN